MYTEAIELMRFCQKKGVSHATLTTAMQLAQFSFPLEKKLEVITQTIQGVEILGGTVWALNYFFEPFRKAESDYHKGTPPAKGSMMKVSDILGIRE